MKAVNEETDKIYKRLAELEREVVNLRGGYVIVNNRYTEALSSLKNLTFHAKEAATRAAAAAGLSRDATRHSAAAAKDAAIHSAIAAASAAAEAAAEAAKAATESAAAAAAASAAASASVVHQADEKLFQAAAA